MIWSARLRWRSPDRSGPMAGDLPGGSRDRAHTRQGRKCRLGMQPAGIRPAHQHLCGADGPNPVQLQQPRGDGSDQRGQLGLERIGLGLQELDALRSGPQRANGCAVLQRLGWPGAQPGTGADLGDGGTAAQFGAQLFWSAHDQRLGLVGRLHPGLDRAMACGQQHPQRFTVAASARCWCVVEGERFSGGADRVDRIAFGAALAPLRLAGRLGRPTSTTRSPWASRKQASPAP